MSSPTTASATHPLQLIIPTNDSAVPPAHANGSVADGITPLDTPRHTHALPILQSSQPETQGDGIHPELEAAGHFITHPHPGALHVLDTIDHRGIGLFRLPDVLSDTFGHRAIGLFRVPGSPVDASSSPTTSRRPSARVARRSSHFTVDDEAAAESQADGRLPPTVESPLEVDGGVNPKEAANSGEGSNLPAGSA